MRRIRLALAVLAVLALVAAACGDDDTFGSTTAAPGTTGGASTTTGASTTAASSTTEAPTTTTFPGATPVDHTAYCVRGTVPSDTLNVRSGPGTGFEVVGELAWDAIEVPAGGLRAPDAQGRPWFRVGYEGGLGWAAGWYLEPAPCTAAASLPAPLTGAGMPAALPGGLVPWSWVDETWVLALYATDWGGPHALYLLSPYGDTYEVFSWTDATLPFDLYDWRPDGRAVLAFVGFEGSGDREIRLLDLAARTSAPVLAIPELGEGGPATFTRPTGRDLVLAAGDAATEVIEVRRTDGSLFSTLLSTPRSSDWRRKASWVYGLEGTTAVVGDGDGLALVSNMGDPISDLDAPGEACRPVRWWDADTVLVRCLAPEVLALEPMAYYGRLWLVPADGSAAAALTALPAEPPNIVDFGFFDAWRLGGRVFANWAGDCGAAAVHVVHPDGTSESVTGNQAIGTLGPNLVVRRWTSCDQQDGSLHLVGPDGGDLSDLLVPPAGAPGVVDALMMRDLP